MKQILILFILAVVSMVACTTQHKTINADISDASEFKNTTMPDTRALEIVKTAIQTPDSIIVSKLIPSDTSIYRSTGKAYVPDKKFDISDSLIFTNFKNTFLSDISNYKNDIPLRLSPFIPVLQIEIFNDNTIDIMQFSFSDKTWCLTQDDRLIFKFNYSNESPIRQLYKNLK